MRAWLLLSLMVVPASLVACDMVLGIKDDHTYQGTGAVDSSSGAAGSGSKSSGGTGASAGSSGAISETGVPSGSSGSGSGSTGEAAGSADEGGTGESGIEPDANTDSPSCSMACTLSTTQCTGNAVQTCQLVNGCPGWVTTVTCGANQTCSAGDAGSACACKGSVCTQAGDACQDSTTLATCAKDGDGCFYVSSTKPCTSPMSCSGMAPTASCSLTCSDSCKQAQTVCMSGSLATCTLGSNGCWAYAAPTACGPHQTCAGAVGSASCSCNENSVCSAVGMTCASATSLATCSKDAENCVYASAMTSCAIGGCAAGACCANGYDGACNSGCGVTQCNGSCSNTTANVGSACNSGCGTIGCNGNCSNTTANVGGPCGSCGGKVKCDGSCSVVTPADYNMPCGSCGGKYQCNGSCSVATPGNFGQACSVGVGACQASGTYGCSGCSAVAGTPSPPAYHTTTAPNGSWDWNCDGTVENDLTGQESVAANVCTADELPVIWGDSFGTCMQECATISPCNCCDFSAGSYPTCGQQGTALCCGGSFTFTLGCY